MKVADKILFERIRDYLTVYLPKVRVRCDSTVVSYRRIINDYLIYLANINKTTLAGIRFTMITAESLRSYLEWLVDVKKCVPSTRNLRLSCIRSLCSYFANEDIVFMSEYLKMKQLSKLPSNNTDGLLWLTMDQIRLVLSLPNPVTRFGLRDLAYLSLLYDSGARDSELLGVQLSDLRIRERCSMQVTGKGRKTRVIPISDEVATILKNYLEVFHPEPDGSRHLFYTIRCGIENTMSVDNAARIMNKYESLAKERGIEIPHLHPHLFRHSRSMHLYKAGMPLPLLSEWLGHAQLETTLIYAHADTDMKRRAIEAAMEGEDPVVERQPPVYDDDELLRRIYALA